MVAWREASKIRRVRIKARERVSLISMALAVMDKPKAGERLRCLRGWMSGADYKILVSLTTLWSLGGPVALLAAGICGGVVALFTRNRFSTFPGVTAMAFGVVLTFLADIVIYLAEVVS